MATRRRCGTYRLYITLTERDEYGVRIARDRRHVYEVFVQPPVVLTRALDHPESFDAVAGAAMAFFADESVAYSDALADLDGATFAIRRSGAA